ncbi:uncharacterized protein LOC129732723 isoform X2 [Wyeomyia smithii]|uniref:uncharacterized protein LOC129732723 isoform X2 n=1 Tax=Wyeomyia smithii TaxID=174621 RepID=UPI0024681438|nr:uncharacterized protein LOC129732723 isoform X2 [Wyeomyia smithii]
MAGVACTEIPTSMNKDFFTDVIETKLNSRSNEFSIEKLTVKHATEAGDNYISKLYRVTVDVQCLDGSFQQVPLIVKTKADLGPSGAFLDILDVFTKETEVYTKLLPAFEQLYRDQGQEIDGGHLMFRELIAVTQPNVNGFNVLNHGDAWCNNMMFQYDNDNAIEDMLLVDFQVGLWSSPAIDLLYFIISSVKGEDKLSKFDSMIHFYHQNLVSNLKLLEYSGQVPTLKELHLDLIDRIFYGFGTSMGLLAICLMEKTEDASIDTMMSDGDAGRAFRDKMMGNPAYTKQMAELLPFFHNHGAFDMRHSGFQTPSGIQSDFLMLPGWLRREFFHDVVEKKLHLRTDQFSIQNIKVEIATKNGESYGSTMYRAKLKVENKVTNTVDTFSVIVKTRPDGMADKFSQHLATFSKEIDVYTKLIPAFEELYRQKGVHVEIGPRCLKTCQSIPSDIIVLDDLRSANFKPPSRLNGLNTEQLEEIIDKLAQFHAASAVYKELNGDFSTAYNEGLFNRNSLPVMKATFSPAYDAFLEAVETFPFAKDCVEKFRNLRPVVFSRILDTVVVDPDGFNVLNHGDLWCNNLMFRPHSDTNRCEGMLFDFQVCFYGSPMLDFNFLLFSSAAKDIKVSKLNYFIRFYHEKLVSYLTLLNYGKRLPTLKQLQFDFNDRIVYGATTIFGAMAIALMEPSEDASIEMLHLDNEAGKRSRQHMYTNERYVKTMEIVLPYLVQRGAFDFGAEVCNIARMRK